MVPLNIPPTTVPRAGETVVRLATIPHGNSLLAQGQGFTVKGGPQIQTISSTPEEIRQELQLVRAELEGRGREPSEITVSMLGPAVKIISPPKRALNREAAGIVK